MMVGDNENDNQLHVRFATKEQAAWALNPLNEKRIPTFSFSMTVKDKDGKAMQVPAERNPYGFYNNVPYDDRGWPTFETGCASAVEAHLYKNKNQGTPYNGDFDAAEEYQPKLTDISKGPDGTGKKEVVRITKAVEKVLDEVYAKLDVATFTGKGDKEIVKNLLKDYHNQMIDMVTRIRHEKEAKENRTTVDAVARRPVNPKIIAPDMAGKIISEDWKQSMRAKRKQERTQHGLARSMSSASLSSAKVAPLDGDSTIADA